MPNRSQPIAQLHPEPQRRTSPLGGGPTRGAVRGGGPRAAKPRSHPAPRTGRAAAIAAALALTLAACSETLPEGWDPVTVVAADIGGTRLSGEPRFPAGPRVTVAAPLTCATDFDPRDSYASLRAEAEAVDGIGLNDRTFALADFPAAFWGERGPAVTQRVGGTSVIFIARDISQEEKRVALLHELDHILCGLRH